MYFLYGVLPLSILKLFRMGIFPIRETSLLLRMLFSAVKYNNININSTIKN
jgi:hypothetical protein